MTLPALFRSKASIDTASRQETSRDALDRAQSRTMTTAMAASEASLTALLGRKAARPGTTRRTRTAGVRFFRSHPWRAPASAAIHARAETMMRASVRGWACSRRIAGV